MRDLAAITEYFQKPSVFVRFLESFSRIRLSPPPSWKVTSSRQEGLWGVSYKYSSNASSNEAGDWIHEVI